MTFKFFIRKQNKMTKGDGLLRQIKVTERDKKNLFKMVLK